MSDRSDDERLHRDLATRVHVLENLLIEKSLVDRKALDAVLERYESIVGPKNGAKLVAKAWVDPAFHAWLMSAPDAAIASMGYTGRQGEHVVVLANTPTVHNLVVCTLCSCYPWPLLGLPPTWYKSAPYRSRAVIDPRGVLAEFGLRLGPDVEIRVWDSNAEVRYLVLPMRPVDTDEFSEEALAALVSRNAMIGTDIVHAPPRRSIDKGAS